MVTEKTECFRHSLFDSVLGKFGGFVRRNCPEFDVDTFQVEDAFGSQDAGNGIQASVA